jgi:hypothetical protein
VDIDGNGRWRAERIIRIIAVLPTLALAALVPNTAISPSAARAARSPAFLPVGHPAAAPAVQAAVTASVERWSRQLVTAYRRKSPTKWTPPALGVTRAGLQVIGLALNSATPGGTWVLEDLLKRSEPGGVLLPDTSDSIAVHRIGSGERFSYFAQVTSDVDSVRDHAWAISIQDLDTLQCEQLGLVSFWCSQGPTLTTRRSRSFGERPISLAEWHVVEAQMQREINAALRLAPIHGPVLPNLPEQFFPEGTA